MDKKKGLQELFNTVAQGYDHRALSFFPQTAQKIITYMVGSTKPSRWLDVCTGTGVVALEAAKAMPSASVVGIDLSRGMLQRAETKAFELGLKNTNFLQMDLDHLAFEPASFDYASCSFGLFFLDDMEQGLSNIVFKVKPTGKIALSAFSEGAFEPFSSLFLSLYESYGYEAPPLSWKKMTTDQQLIDLYETANIGKVQIYREPLGFQLSSAVDWWDVVWNAGYRGLLLQMSEAEMARFKQQHLAQVQRLRDQGDHWLDTSVVIAVGEV